MAFLLDTHALLWWLFDDPKLSPPVRGILADPSNEVFVSAVSAWEIATKHRLGRLNAASVLVQDIAGWVERAGFTELPVSLAHAQRAGSWPQPHRDPFDRMLAAQSVLNGLRLISCDKTLEIFGLDLLW